MWEFPFGVTRVFWNQTMVTVVSCACKKIITELTHFKGCIMQIISQLFKNHCNNISHLFTK